MNKALVVVPPVLVSLIVGIWAGSLRLGWPLAPLGAAAQHGALMVGSFLGTLIYLERAVTFKNRWILLLPAVNVSSMLFFITGQPGYAQLCLVLGSTGFCMMCGYFISKYGELYYYVFFAGAFCMLAGHVILLKTHFYPQVVAWWMAALLFTIVAERLELSKFLPLRASKRAALIVSLGVTFVSLFLPFHGPGRIVFAISLVLTATWLLVNDMARRALHLEGQHRYSAVSLLCGYVWLLVTATLLLLSDQFAFSYDAALHSFFIGFVFLMIFSHAPIILPALLRQPVKIYRPLLYAWSFLLQASLLLRVTGDLTGHTSLRKWGGGLNGLVILLFFASIALIVRIEITTRNHRLAKA